MYRWPLYSAIQLAWLLYLYASYLKKPYYFNRCCICYKWYERLFVRHKQWWPESWHVGSVVFNALRPYYDRGCIDVPDDACGWWGWRGAGKRLLSNPLCRVENSVERWRWRRILSRQVWRVSSSDLWGDVRAWRWNEGRAEWRGVRLRVASSSVALDI